MKLRNAKIEDIEKVLELHSKYQIDTINQDDKKDGFITTSFTKEQLKKLILEEEGLFIALKDDEIVAYIMSASWQFWSIWPMFVHMIKDLPNLKYLNQTLSLENSYQYGPVCVNSSVRGTGVLEKLFEFTREKMSKKYPILVTFINKINTRSYEAHTRKLGLEVIQEFEFNNNKYYELVYDTSKKLSI
ncbi:MAG: GNAT family acetyltransferase [Aliarcobacter sp.]|nr:GNAT family acetyltransferase [Aliarcobacter sp.]